MGKMSSNPASPIGPGRPNSKSQPDQTMAGVVSPIGPGAPKNKSQPANNMAKVKSPIGPGAVKNRKQPKLPGIPGREGSVKGGSRSKKSGARMGGKSTLAAGVPPGYGP
jgi:hypothetical protein